jgi:hypothetical protein
MECLGILLGLFFSNVVLFLRGTFGHGIWILIWNLDGDAERSRRPIQKNLVTQCRDSASYGLLYIRPAHPSTTLAPIVHRVNTALSSSSTTSSSSSTITTKCSRKYASSVASSCRRMGTLLPLSFVHFFSLTSHTAEPTAVTTARPATTPPHRYHHRAVLCPRRSWASPLAATCPPSCRRHWGQP